MRAGVKYGTRGKREEWGNKWGGGGDKGGVKVPVYTTAKRNTVSVENESRKGYRLCFDWRVDSQIQSEKPDSFFTV